MATNLPVSSVVSVDVEMSPTAAALRNFGASLIIGSTDVIDTDERIRLYSDIDDIATDFGTTAPEYLAAVAFFSQAPRPKQVYIGRWAESATAGRIKGRILTEDEQTLSIFTAITAGTMTLTVDGTEVSVSAVDLSAETNLNGVAAQVTSGLGGKATCTWTGERFVITSATTGSSSSVSVTDSDTLSSALGFTSGATSVAGSDAETLTEAVTELLDYQTWYSAVLASTTATSEDIIAAAKLIEAASPSRVLALTDQDTANIDSSTYTTTLGAQLSDLGLNHTLVVYSSSSPYAAASVLGRMSTVNFEGSDTTLTLKFKQLPGIAAESLRSSQAALLKTKHVNVFAAYQNGTSILQEGVMSGGWYIDERHGLDWLIDRIQTDVWNLLYTTKKVGQDESGMNALIATVTKSLEQGVANGLIAPGVWNGDGFGALETGDTLSTGYYVYIAPLSEQSTADREARKAPPIQIAVKLKGAIHFVDCSIVVNR
jgi:hypothetical protein